MRLWRVTRAPFAALDGEGARIHGGRYSAPGLPVVALANEAALAVLITLRYLPPDLAGVAEDYVLGWTEVDAVPERMADDGDDRRLRDSVGLWLEERRSLLAAISSRVLPEADVVLLNPRHPDAAGVPPLRTRPFDFAACLHTPPMRERFAQGG
ncbi:RES domain-containing protein [Novosphingobium fluoreni]|uniref:RES domain-containing protein n=1 Tax=Novosphingobium fluoreni TaxID=1391222 RepID=A0A7W6BXW3_9SPHN|nr:RES family NAD+ phosphorylase [Novosphingobium fluoreni]MBB3939951.1 RES domain-containing protein [Novosphingobium fluoreni]